MASLGLDYPLQDISIIFFDHWKNTKFNINLPIFTWFLWTADDYFSAIFLLLSLSWCFFFNFYWQFDCAFQLKSADSIEPCLYSNEMALKGKVLHVFFCFLGQWGELEIFSSRCRWARAAKIAVGGATLHRRRIVILAGKSVLSSARIFKLLNFRILKYWKEVMAMMGEYGGRVLPDYEAPGAKQQHFSPYADNGGWVIAVLT